MKGINSDMEAELNELRQANCKLELQLCEQNMLLEECTIRNKTLEVEQRSFTESMHSTIQQIASYLSVKTAADDLTKSTIEENQTLKAENESLQSRVIYLEAQLKGCEERLESLSSIQIGWETNKAAIKDSSSSITNIAMSFEQKLNKLIADREKALAESIACSPNDALVRKNKQLAEEVETAATENMMLRSEINDLKSALRVERERNAIMVKEVDVAHLG